MQALFQPIFISSMIFETRLSLHNCVLKAAIAACLLSTKSFSTFPAKISFLMCVCSGEWYIYAKSEFWIAIFTFGARLLSKDPKSYNVFSITLWKRFFVERPRSRSQMRSNFSSSWFTGQIFGGLELAKFSAKNHCSNFLRNGPIKPIKLSALLVKRSYEMVLMAVLLKLSHDATPA